MVLGSSKQGKTLNLPEKGFSYIKGRKISTPHAERMTAEICRLDFMARLQQKRVFTARFNHHLICTQSLPFYRARLFSRFASRDPASWKSCTITTSTAAVMSITSV